MKNKQRGLSLTTLILVCIVIGLVAVVGMKVVPEVIEYTAIVKNVKATAEDPATKTASVQAIRVAFQKRASIDNISAITPADLDITKEGSDVVITFAYDRKIPLYGPVSLLINFEGSSAK